MLQIKDNEKYEMLQNAESDSLREDMRKLEENRKILSFSEEALSFDASIHFLSQINAFANHCPRPFVRMDGRFFIL